MVILIKKNMKFYRQDNSATERTLKMFNASISHVLCGFCTVGNLLVLAGHDVDVFVPIGMQLEDYFHGIIQNVNTYNTYLKQIVKNDNAFWAGDQRYYPWLVNFVFGEELLKYVENKINKSGIIKYLEMGYGLGVCQRRGDYYHFITIAGYENGMFQIIDSAPDLAGGKMIYDIPESEMDNFSPYYLVVKRLANG